jgi:hypothetical protein
MRRRKKGWHLLPASPREDSSLSETLEQMEHLLGAPRNAIHR